MNKILKIIKIKIKSLTVARQTLYHLSHSTSPQNLA
jgi:hypothetical protein